MAADILNEATRRDVEAAIVAEVCASATMLRMVAVPRFAGEDAAHATDQAAPVELQSS